MILNETAWFGRGAVDYRIREFPGGADAYRGYGMCGM
jgi:hypothetical protein